MSDLQRFYFSRAAQGSNSYQPATRAATRATTRATTREDKESKMKLCARLPCVYVDGAPHTVADARLIFSASPGCANCCPGSCNTGVFTRRDRRADIQARREELTQLAAIAIVISYRSLEPQ